MTPEERAEAFLLEYLNDTGHFANGSGLTSQNIASFIREAERDAELRMRERAAKLLDDIVAEHLDDAKRSWEECVKAVPSMGPFRHEFCDEYGCGSLQRFATAIRALEVS